MADDPVPIPPEGQLLIYQDGALRLQVRIDGKTVWLTQRLIAELYQVSVKTVSEHLRNVYEEHELDPAATVKQYLTVQIEGARQVRRALDHQSLEGGFVRRFIALGIVGVRRLLALTKPASPGAPPTRSTCSKANSTPSTRRRPTQSPIRLSPVPSR